MNTNCSTDPCGGAPIDAHCVKFTLQELSCIGATINDRVDDILVKIDAKLCDLTGNDDDHIFDVLCAAVDDTDSIHMFCDHDDNTIKSQLIVNLGDNSLTDIMFWTGTEVRTRTIDSVFQDIQDSIGDIFQDTNTIDLTYDSILNILTADVKISATPNNALEAFPDGLWAQLQLNTQTGLAYGGQVTWTGTGYIYDIAEAGYYINGQFYTSLATTVSLDAGDGTYNRLDSFIVDTSGVASVLQGTPDANPLEPAIDLGTQLRLQTIIVQANTVQPLQDQCIYQEGTEWIITESASFDEVSTGLPCFGDVSIEATNPATGDNILFAQPSFTPFAPNIYGTLQLLLTSKGAWTGGTISLQWENFFIPIGSPVIIGNTSYGFNELDLTSCQMISIPLNFFQLGNGDMADSIRITVQRGITDTSFGFYIDNFCLSTEQQGSSSIALYQFQNGLRQTPNTNVVEFGGNPLLHNTTLDTNSFVQTFSGATVYNYPYQFVGRQSFENGTGITSFLHKGSLDPLAADFVNNVRLGINYTGNIYNAITDLNGYFGPDDIGYWMGVNGQGHGSFGVYTDDSASKTGGIFWHTLDSASTDMLTIYGKQPSTINGDIGINAGGTGFLDYKIATFKTNKQWQGHGYGIGTFVDPSPAYNTAWDANGNLVEQVIDCPVGVISGGFITWVSDLIFEIEPTVYYIDCVRYEILVPTQITLDPSDPTDPRIDVLALSSAGFIKITGVAAADPESPQTDGDDIFLTHVLINANAVVPADVSSETIYDENVEWTHTTTNLTANFNGATNVVHLTKNIDVSTFVNGGYIEFTSLSGPFDLTTWAALRLYYRNKTSGSPRLVFSWWQGAVQKTATFIYNPTNNTAASQSIVIPISSFSFLTNSTVDKLRIAFGPLIIPAYIDWIQLQKGLVIAGGPSTTITADNGLLMSTATNVQLGSSTAPGSALLHNSYIDASTFSLIMTGSINGNVLDVTNSNANNVPAIKGTATGTSGTGIWGSALQNGAGVTGTGVNGSGVIATSTANYAITATGLLGSNITANNVSTNTATEISTFSRGVTGGVGAAGVGGIINITVEDDAGNVAVSTQLKSIWTVATHATRTSTLDLWGVNSATLLKKASLDSASGFTVYSDQTVPTLTAELNTTPNAWSVTGGVTFASAGRYNVSGSGTLFFNFGTLTAGSQYVINYTCNLIGITTSVTLGGDTAAALSGGGTIFTVNRPIITTNTSGLLTITVSSAGGGAYVEAISVKRITAATPISFANNTMSGFNEFEVRSDFNNASMFVGLVSGRYDYNGTFNTAFGHFALTNNISGHSNIAIGNQALGNDTRPTSSIAIGVSALAAIRYSEYNIAIGSSSQAVATSGFGNVSLGVSTLASMTTGSSNVAIGYATAFNVTTGSSNVMVGTSAAGALTTASGTVAVGHAAGSGVTTGSNNVFMGVSAGGSISTGQNNVGIGYAALTGGITTGSDNIGIGYFNTLAQVSSGFEIIQHYSANAADNRNVLIGNYSWLDKGADVAVTDAIAIGYQSRAYQDHQAVLGGTTITSTFLRGDVETRNYQTVGGQTLADFTFPGGTTKWAVTGAVTLGTNKAIFNQNSGSTGTLTQVAADMAIPGKSGRYYRLQVSLSWNSAPASTGTLTVTGSTFASTDLVPYGTSSGAGGSATYTMYFKSKTTPTDITFTWTAGANNGDGIINITQILLNEVTGGDMFVNRNLEVYGGALKMTTQFTPANSTDATYAIGTMTADDSFLWYRKSNGNWVKAAWAAF